MRAHFRDRSASSSISGTAAGNLWDSFDETTSGVGITITDLLITAGPGDDTFLYTSPELMDGLTAVLSYEPQNTGTESGTGYGINYSGVEGLTLNYASSDTIGATTAASGTNEVLKATYAYGSFTVGYSRSENDLDSTGVDTTMTSMAATYTLTDELSITYGVEESETSTASDQDAE